MAKTKTPFFSIGSKGTVGGSLTSQKRGSATILREKPVPTDPYSLNQAYQRWDYRDYAYRWTLLSNADKQVYRTKASRYHITGFSQFMRESLKALTDLSARWHMDEKAGAIAYDTSRNARHATIFGASPVPGRIGGAFSFDGINDYLDCGSGFHYPTSGDMTIEFFATIHTKPGAGWYPPVVLTRGATPSGIMACYGGTWDRWVIFLSGPGVDNWITVDNASTLDTCYHIAFIAKSGMLYSLVDGVQQAMSKPAPATYPPDQDLWVARRGAFYFHITIDHLAIHGRALDTTELIRHSERRYPS